jgi:hypothetical protein
MVNGGGPNRWAFAELTPEYCQHHFFAGMVLSNLRAALETASSSAVLNRFNYIFSLN